MQVLKTFVRNGARYKPGDPAPQDLDAETTAHYKRHGMVGDPPKPKRPARASRQEPAAPQHMGAAAPAEAAQAAPQQADSPAPDEGG